MEEDHDSRANPLPPLTVNTKDYAGVRVWRASNPIFDNTDNPFHGTVGVHVHCYSKTQFTKRGDRLKIIDDTYESVTIDGVVIK